MVLPRKPGAPPLYKRSDEEGLCKQSNATSSEWTPKAVGILLDRYAEKFLLGRGYLRTNDWQEVVRNVNTQFGGLKSLKTVRQCRDKVDSLKRRYKVEKRKVVNGSTVTWPFFTKLDEMMGSLLKQGRSLVTLQQRSSVVVCTRVDEEDIKFEHSDSPQECALDSARYNGSAENGKAVEDNVAGLSEDGLQRRLYEQPMKYSSPTGEQESTDNSAENPLPHQKRKLKSDTPFKASAHAITGFSEVFARIELAKIEISTKMRLELANLERKRRKKG